MIFLPIVERELRVATRRRFTYWLRVVAAAVALIIGGCYFLLITTTPFVGGVMTVGGPLFAILTWLSLAVVLSAGLFFTSDCLSEEKREGTLGFLFLTDLRGYDVVLGKLFATSLRCAFALLAVFPILAVTLLLGGVESGQFWKTMLALLNALFCSLATGMFVSAVSRNGQKALAGTLGLMALWVFGGLVLDGIIDHQRMSPRRMFSLSSPVHVFWSVEGWRGSFWPTLFLNQILAWLQMALACVLIRRNWQERASKTEPRLSKWSSWWRRSGEKRRRALREKWLSRDPMLWLALRERGLVSTSLLWPALFVAVVIVVVFEWTGGEMWALWRFLSGALSLAVYLSVASQAAQFFAEARRTRLVELLLAAPLDPRQIVMGPWRALVRLFAGPVLLLILMQLVGAANSVSMRTTRFAGLGVNDNVVLLCITTLIGALVTVANLAAMGWFGLWMGMTSRNALLATLKTIVFVQIVPWFVVTIAVPLVLLPVLIYGSGTGNDAFMFWYPLLTTELAAVLSLGKDVFFWRWSRRKLMRDFREQATRVVAPVVIHLPAARIPAPPIIPARQ